METKDVKKACELAEEELKKSNIDKLKDVIKVTLERIESIDKKIRGLQEERKLLRLDIEDLKLGKLDRIQERQNKDPKAKEISTIVIKEIIHEHYVTPQYIPYVVTIKEPYIYPYTTWCASGSSMNCSFTIDGNTVSHNATGAYNLTSGDIIHLR